MKKHLTLEKFKKLISHTNKEKINKNMTLYVTADVVTATDEDDFFFF